jgi:hypothetical protein
LTQKDQLNSIGVDAPVRRPRSRPAYRTSGTRKGLRYLGAAQRPRTDIEINTGCDLPRRDVRNGPAQIGDRRGGEQIRVYSSRILSRGRLGDWRASLRVAVGIPGAAHRRRCTFGRRRGELRLTGPSPRECASRRSSASPWPGWPARLQSSFARRWRIPRLGVGFLRHMKSKIRAKWGSLARNIGKDLASGTSWAGKF